MTTKALIINDKKSLQQRIFEFIQAANDRFTIEKTFLFGSTAKAKRHSESDVDLIIVSKNFKNLPALDRVSKLLELWPYIEELELLTYTPQEFEIVKDRLLMKEILSYAIDLTPKSSTKAKLQAVYQKKTSFA
jgi:predicted nucleotidyltransferase